jgi:glycosyltransferase involved in cell wall biosynthesis
VIIPVLNDAARLHRCLDALLAQVDAPAFDVVVVDNGSTDDTAAVAHNHPLRPLVLVERRRGSYAARNAGITATAADVLAFTDADCLPLPDWVAAGCRAVQLEPVVGGEIAAIRSPVPSLWERYDRALYLRQQKLVEDGGFAATANLWVRREVLLAAGPFDGRLRSSGDFEWGRRAAAEGFPTTYSAEVRVGHAPRTTARQTWQLHRRLGAGWRVLVVDHPALRDYRDVPLWRVIEALEADGPPLRRRQVAHVHLLAMTARRVGWSQSTRRRARTEP